MSQERKLVEEWIKQNPRIASGIEYAISGAEGTLRGGKPGYNVLFGGGTFEGFSRHPNKVIKSPGGYASTAAGSSQFLSTTYDELQKRLGLSDFSPQSQRIATIAKVRERLKPIGGLAALTKAGQLTPEIQAALAPEWASFPTASGKSYYGQPVKKAEQIQKFFQQGMQAGAPPPPQLPSTDTAKSVQKGNQQGDTLLQRIMKYIPMVGTMPPLSSIETPELDGQSFLNAYRMFFDDQEMV